MGTLNDSATAISVYTSVATAQYRASRTNSMETTVTPPKAPSIHVINTVAYI